MSTGSSCEPLSRRTFLTLTANAAALGAASASCSPARGGNQPAASPVPQDLIGDGRKRRILLRGGVVLSLDAKVGDFERADVLIDGKTIAQIAPDISAGDAEVVDCSGTIVQPPSRASMTTAAMIRFMIPSRLPASRCPARPAVCALRSSLPGATGTPPAPTSGRSSGSPRVTR